MKQYLRLLDKNTIQTPREQSDKTLGLDESWGEGLYVEVDLEPGFCATCFEDKLKDGKAVVSDNKVKKFQEENRSRVATRKKEKLRIRKMISIRNAIDANKSVDQLTAIERKVAYGVGGVPTDSELGIE